MGFFCIFFLTGCASERYHKPPVSLSSGTGTKVSQGLSLGWPVQGRVLQPFGTIEDGVTLKGMVIAAEEGSPVLASEWGTVVYVDGSLRGYGKTVIIEHDDGFSTVYARNSLVTVAVGDRVRKGQVIAKSGLAGKGSIPELYFEVRKDTRAVDPKQFLL